MNAITLCPILSPSSSFRWGLLRCFVTLH